MPYTNATLSTSLDTTYNAIAPSYTSFSSLQLITGIDLSAQLEVERVFATDRTGNTLTITNFMNNADVKLSDKRAVYVIPITRCTLNATTSKITAIDLPASGNVYNYTYYLISDPTNANALTIQVPSIVQGSALTIRRKTVTNQSLVSWVDGSKLTSAQLNLQTKQLLYLAQEMSDTLNTELARSNDITSQIADGAVTPTKISSTTDPWSFYGTIQTVAPTANLHATTRLYTLDKFFQHGVMTKDDVAPTSSAVDILETAATAGNSGLWFNPKNGTINLWAGNAWVTVAGTPVTTANLVTTNTVQTVTAAKTFAAGTVVPFTQTGTGAVARTVDAKLKDTVSVKDFGAVGDGVTDDTAAIQAALNSGFNRVYVPKGVYRFISQLVIPSNTILFGDGDSSVFDWGGSTNAGKLVVVGSTTNVTLQSFKVDCNSADGTISLGNKDIGIVVDTSGSQITIQNITIYDAARHALVVQSGNIIRLENINITLGCVSSALLVGSFPASYGFVVNQSTVDVFLSNILVDYVKSDAIGFWNCGGGDGYSTLCKNIVCNNIIVKRWGRGLGVSYAFWNSGITTEVTDMALSNFVFNNQNVGNNQGRGLHQESGSRLSFSNGSIVNLITTTPANTSGYALSIQGGTGLNFSNIHIENTGIGVVASSSSADRVYLNQISVKNSTYAGVYLLYPKQFVFDGCFFEHDRSIGTQENAFYCLLNDAFNVTNLTIQNTHLHLKNGTLGAPYALHIGSLTPTSFAGCQISLFNLHSPNTNLLNNGSYFPDIYVGESVSVKILETVAAATDYEVPIMQSGQKTCVLSCRSSFSTGIPSDATNFNTYDLYKRNSAGGGATLMTIGNTTFAAQDWVTAFETCSFRIVDTISQSHLANNESLTWRKTHGGLGQAETNGTVTVQYVTF